LARLRELRESGFLTLVPVDRSDFFIEIVTELDLGETAAICYAVEEEADLLLIDELAERRRQDMIAAELADEASGYGDPASVLDDTPLDRFDQQELAVGLDQLDEFEAGSSTPGASPVAKPLDDYSGRRSEPRPSPGPEVPPEAIRKLRLVVGALLLEALLIKRTKDTIQSRFNRAESFVLGDDSIPVQLTDHLWSVCSAADRGDIVETILEGSQRDAMDEILALCKETGISID
jgi:hypothetical protein